jgi:hypothetical protein
MRHSIERRCLARCKLFRRQFDAAGSDLASLLLEDWRGKSGGLCYIAILPLHVRRAQPRKEERLQRRTMAAAMVLLWTVASKLPRCSTTGNGWRPVSTCCRRQPSRNATHLNRRGCPPVDVDSFRPKASRGTPVRLHRASDQFF